MYTKRIPYTDHKGKPQNEEVQFNLETREVLKLAVEFRTVFDWREQAKKNPERELEGSELVDFYNAFEEILLSAWGEMSDDGRYFHKSGRYDFEASKLFSACMEIYISDPEETSVLLDSIMPKGMAEVIKSQNEGLERMKQKAESGSPEQAEIAQLQAKLAALQNN